MTNGRYELRQHPLRIARTLKNRTLNVANVILLFVVVINAESKSFKNLLSKGEPVMREMNSLLIFTLQGIPQLLTYNFPEKVT